MCIVFMNWSLFIPKLLTHDSMVLAQPPMYEYSPEHLLTIPPRNLCYKLITNCVFIMFSFTYFFVREKGTRILLNQAKLIVGQR